MEHLKPLKKAVLEKKATWWKMELPNGSVSFGSAKAEMLGYPSSHFDTYTKFTDLLHPDDYEKAMEAMKYHIDGQKNFYETSYRIQHKNGTYLQFYDIGQVIERSEGKVVIMGFVWSIEKDVNSEELITSIKQGILEGNPPLIDIVKGIQKDQMPAIEIKNTAPF